jgi:hypothetical protein
MGLPEKAALESGVYQLALAEFSVSMVLVGCRVRVLLGYMALVWEMRWVIATAWSVRVILMEYLVRALVKGLPV